MAELFGAALAIWLGCALGRAVAAVAQALSAPTRAKRRALLASGDAAMCAVALFWLLTVAAGEVAQIPLFARAVRAQGGVAPPMRRGGT